MSKKVLTYIMNGDVVLADGIVAVYDTHVGAVVLSRHSVHGQVGTDDVRHILAAINIYDVNTLPYWTQETMAT